MRIELSDRAKLFALDLLDRFDGHISASVLFSPFHHTVTIYQDLAPLAAFRVFVGSWYQVI